MAKEAAAMSAARGDEAPGQGQGTYGRRRLVPFVTIQARGATVPPLVTVPALDDPARALVAGRAKDGRLSGSLGGIGPAKVAETGGPRPRGVAAAVSKLRTEQLLIEEARLLPRAETVLARPLKAAPLGVARPVSVPLRPVGGLVLLGAAPRLGRARATRVTGHARVAQVSPTLDPVVEEAGHPAPRPVLRPAARQRTAVAATLWIKSAKEVPTRVADHGVVGQYCRA